MRKSRVLKGVEKMKKNKESLFWFTNDYGEIVANDYYGTIEKAEKYIKNFMHKKLIDCDVYINDHDEIVGVVFI